MGHIFTQVNAAFEELEDGDEEESECVYEEFRQVLCRICDARIPPDRREPGEDFAVTLQRWLHLLSVPRYKQLLKDKARGVGSKTL